MSTPLREIAAVFGITFDPEKNLEKGNERVESFVGKLKEAGKLVVEALAGHEVIEFFKGQVEAAAHLQDTSEKLDIAVDDLKAFGFAAKSAGLDSEAASSMLGRFERQLSGAGKGGGTAAAELKKLGVDTKGKGTLDVILGLSDAMQKMPTHAEKVAAAIKVFGRQGLAMVPILEKGKDALEDMFNESRELGSGLGGEFYQDAKKAREEFEHMGYAVESLKERALAAMLPYIITLGKWLKSVAKDVIEFTKHTNLLKTAMLFLAGIAGLKLISTFKSILSVLGILQPTITGTIAALMRFLAPIAIIVALYLLFDDFYTLMTGGKSVIGDVLDSLFGFGTATQFVKDITAAAESFIDVLENVGDAILQGVIFPFEQAFDAAKSLGSAIGDLLSGKAGAAWEDLKKGGTEMAADMAKRDRNIRNDVSDLGEDFTTSTAGRAKTRANRRKAAPGAYAPGGEFFSGPSAAGPGPKTFQEILAARQHLPIPGAAAGAGKHGPQVHQVNHVKVDVKTDSHQPDAVGKAAAGGVEKGMKRSNLNAQKAALVP